ncbi:MAG: hypothetical protein FJX64_03080 [Alphaproteobacteria bacterium]|nr:hypothetical protein [Alphaproteobacteria bacterium]
MTWIVVVLWLAGDARLPTPSGTLLLARETFATEAACVAALPAFHDAVLRDFGTPGVVACAPRVGPPAPAEVAARIAPEAPAR